MDASRSQESVRFPVSEIEQFVAQILTACATSAHNAASTAQALVAAERDGQSGHGLSRTRSYAEQALSGKVDGFAVPHAERTADAALRVDAGGGFAYPAIDVAIHGLTDMVPRTGSAVAAIFNSHHFGQAGRHVERLADQGLVALAFSNTPKAMAMPGASKPLFGTNPLAFAAPVAGRPAIVIDLALSVVARGKVVQAHRAGEKIPPDWAIDSDGCPTEDPAMALGGSLLPIGGPKGMAIAMAIEILCAALAGAAFSWEASSLFEADGPRPHLGHVLIALSPSAFAATSFADRMQQLVLEVGSQGRLPGDSRLPRRADAAAYGLKVSREWINDVSKLRSHGRRRV